MKVNALVAASILLIGLSGTAQATDTGPNLGQFRQYYTPTPDDASRSIHHWFTGYAEAIGVFYMTLKMEGSPTPFCLPDRYDLRGGLPALIQQFDAKSKSSGVSLPGTYPLSAAAFAALSSTFPCGSPGGA